MKDRQGENAVRAIEAEGWGGVTDEEVSRIFTMGSLTHSLSHSVSH